MKRMLSKLPVLLVVCLLVGLAPLQAEDIASAAPAPDPSLKLWYPFSETSGTVAKDASGNGNDGILSAGASVSGSGAVVLNGTSGNVQMPNNLLAGVSEITVTTTAWVDAANGTPSWIFSFGNSTGSNGDNYMMMTPGGTNNARFVISNDTWRAEQNVTKTGALAKGVWKQLAFTIRKNTTDSKYTGTFYEDGVAVASNPALTTLPKDLGNGVTNANNIGKPAYSADKWFKGQISDFRVYSRALSQSELNQVMLDSLEIADDAQAVSYVKSKIDLGNLSAVKSNLQIPGSFAGGGTINWSSDDTDAVGNDGTVTRSPDSDRTVHLTATINRGGSTDTRTFTVRVLQYKPVVTLDSTGYTFSALKQTHQTVLTAYNQDGSSTNITALAEKQSSNPAVATVNADGVVTGISAGSSIISFTYLGVVYKVNVMVLEGTDTMPSGGGQTVTLAVLPDTQMYSRYKPEIFDAQAKWITDNSAQESLDFTVHLGDIVDRRDQDYEWTNAQNALNMLHNAKVPYSYVTGNHDIADWTWDDNRGVEKFQTYFPPSKRMVDSPGYRGTDGYGYSSYYTFEAAGRTFTVLALDWRASKKTLDWAQGIINMYPDNPVILTTHQLLNIDSDGESAIMTDNGQYLWDNLIKKNDQIFLTLNGHHHGAAHMVKPNDNGKDVLMIVTDYQGYYNGGDGFMREMQLDFTHNAIYTKTFSPWVINNVPVGDRTEFDKEELTDKNNRFVVPMNLNERFPEKTPYSVQGVKAHWKFEEPGNGSNTVMDSSGNGNDLTRVDTDNNQTDNPDVHTEWSKDTAPLSLSKGSIEMHHTHLDPLESTYFKTADDAPLNADSFLNGYTVEAFVKVNEDFTPDKNQWMNIMNRGDRVTFAFSNLKEFQWETYAANKTAYQTAWSGENALGKWIHVAAVNNGVTTELYIDGARQLRNQTGNPVGLQTLIQNGQFVPWTIGNPDNSFNGWISEIRITDHALDKNEFLLNSNKPPFSASLSYKTKINTVLNGELSATDADQDSLHYSIVSQPVKGKVSLNSDTGFTYTPNKNAYGSDTFTYKANDGKSDSNIATIKIEITPNLEPEAKGSSYKINMNSPLNGILTASDPNNDPLIYSVVSAPQHGEVNFIDASKGKFEYIPEADYAGKDMFTFKVSDGTAFSEVMTVDIQIIDVKNHIMSYWKFQDPGDGTYNVKDLTGNGNDMYRVDINNADAPDVYMNWDTEQAPQGRSAGSVRMSNDIHYDKVSYFRTGDNAPVNAMTFENGYTIEAIVRIRDFDENKHKWTGLLVRGATGAAGGKTGSDTSEPLAGLNISNLKELQWESYPTNVDEIKTSWSGELINPGWMHIAVVNDGNTSQMYIDGSPQLRYDEGETKGIATALINGKYAPWVVGTGIYGDDWTNGFNGSVSEVRISDIALGKDQFLQVNHAPEAAGMTITIKEGQEVAGQLKGTDPNADPLVYSVAASPLHGTVTLTDKEKGNFIYTPKPGYKGADSFQYVVSDGRLNSSPAVVSFTLNGTNSDLTSLALSAGTLSPVFASTVSDYKATVTSNVYSVTVTAGTYDPDTTVTFSVYGNDGQLVSGYPLELAGGVITQKAPLVTGSNRVELTLTAQDGTQKKYTVQIKRNEWVEPEPTPTPSPTPVPTPTPAPTAAPGPVSTPTPTPTPTVSPSPTPTATVTPVPTATATPQPSAPALSDITQHWAKTAIQQAVELGIVKGYPDGSFKPNGQVNRAEFASLLVRAMKGGTANGELAFADKISTPAWAAASIRSAVDAGWIKGFEDNSFRPLQKVTRIEMTVMAVRALGLDMGTPEKLSFADAKDIPAWANAYVAAAVKAGIVKGGSDNRFNPGAAASRAESIVLLMNMLDYNSSK